MLGLAKIGYYDGGAFHRIIKDFMIQGGCPEGTGTGGPGYKIAAEFNATPHEPGVLSMARTGDPNSAGSQFFICLARVPHLDRQYTAFGRTADADSLAVVQEDRRSGHRLQRPPAKAGDDQQGHRARTAESQSGKVKLRFLLG